MKKNIYILQNSNLSFDMDISQMYAPEKYSLFIIINKFSLDKLTQRKQDHYFDKIWLTENFDFASLREIIINNQASQNLPLQIVTNAEEAIIVCGNLRVYFNIDPVNYDRFKDKLIMKELLNKHDLLTPKHVVFNKKEYNDNPRRYINHITNTLTFPLIAKPIDAMGCNEIEKLDTLDELSKWCSKTITSNSNFEIDEFIEGKVYNCDSYIKNGKIVFTQVSACSNSCYDFICGLTKGTISLPHHDPIYKHLCEYTIQIHDAIGIPLGGVTHLEAILTNDNEIYFIEIGHRSPGILIPAMYKKFLNISTIESHILLQIDDDYELSVNHGAYSAWVAFPIAKGKLNEIHTPIIQSNYEIEWSKRIGDIMTNPTNGRDYVGRLLLWNDDYQKLKNDFDYLNTYQFYTVDNHSISTQCHGLTEYV